MATKRFGELAVPGWDSGDSDPRDKGVIRFGRAAVESINLTLGFGQTSSSCSISVVEEEEGVFQEPNIGSVGRVAIPNAQAGNPALYDSADADYTMSFIGIVRSVNHEDGIGGRNKVVEFLDTKEILRNIPVMLNDMGNVSRDEVSILNNFTDAYRQDAKSGKGLNISAVASGVHSKTYTYYPNNISSAGSTNFQHYNVDLSEFFGERTKTTFSEDIFYGSIDSITEGRFKNGYDDGKIYSDSTRDKFDNLFGDGKRDEDFDGDDSDGDTGADRHAEEEKYIVSPGYKIQGEARNLLDIIDEAMTNNGCDWYVSAYEKSNPNSIETGIINGTVVIKIIPVVRNEFDQFTEDEFESFIGGLDEVQSSTTFGKEFANEESNKVFFGSKWESLQRIPVEENAATDDIMQRFWGFKKDPALLGNDSREIVDRYGNTIKAVSGINENPTFDTTSLAGVDFTDDLMSSNQLTFWLTAIFGYELDETISEFGKTVAELTRAEKISLVESSTEYDDYYNFDLSSGFQKYTFYLLSNLYKTKDVFARLLLSVYDYVEYYDDNKDNLPEAYISRNTPSDKKISKTGFSDVTFCGQDTTSVVELDALYEGDITLGYTHSISISDPDLPTFSIRGKYSDKSTAEITSAGIDYLVKSAIQVYVNNELTFETSVYGISAISDITLSPKTIMQNFLNKKMELNDARVLRYGLSQVEIRAKCSGRLTSEKNYSYVDIYKFYVNWFGLEGNPYDLMRTNPLYLWARAAGIALLRADQVKLDYAAGLSSEKTLTSKSPDGTVAGSQHTVLWAKNLSWQREIFEKRLDSLHSIISAYLDTNLDKKYYKKLGTDEWDIAPEVWDGEAGYTITDPKVRGAFINKQTGKMPCLYRIKNAEIVETNQNDDNTLYIKREDKSGEDVLNLYGVAQAELFAIGKTPNEASDNRYVICTMNYAPKRTKKKEYRATFDKDSSNGVTRGDAINAENTTNTEKALEEHMRSAFKNLKEGAISGNNAKDSFDEVRPTLRITPLAFYVPTIHSFIRYGPWMLDGRNVNLNRSNYGITGIEISDDLNPWEFKSYGDVQNYVLDQNKNTLMTEYRLNRGQVVTADIPRFNIGRKIGKFSNISGISVSYSAGGVSTTYTLTAFGAGEQAKEQREKQDVYKRIRNIETKTPKVGMGLTVEQVNQMLNGISFKA